MKQQQNYSKKDNKKYDSQSQNGLNQNNVSFWGRICPCFSSKKGKANKGNYQDRKSIAYIQHHEETHSNLPVTEQSDYFTAAYQPNIAAYQPNINRNNLKTNKEGIINEAVPKIQKIKKIFASKKQTNQAPNNTFNKFNPNFKETQNNIQSKLQSMNIYQDFNFAKNFQTHIQSQYSVNNISENKLLITGNHKARLICKISSVYIYPYPSAIQRQKQSSRNQKKKYKKEIKDQIVDEQIDKYWEKRYFLFQKFDQGIKLDKQSWYSVTPQSVADYIASKIKFNGVILDGFCGAGGDSIKMAFTCKKVISNDIDPIKIQCLINNAKIYGAQNIQIKCLDFFQINNQVDAVYLAPPWGGPQYFLKSNLFPNDFSPSLNRIFQKSLKLSSNLFFLLPANTNIEQLSACLSNQLVNSKKIYSTCTLKIQKIYFNDRLKFIAGYFGDIIQTDVKINQELDFIYNMLRQSDEGIFKHKKVIRKLRQQYGMVGLLDLVFQCQKKQNQPQCSQNNSDKCLMDYLYEYIAANNLITQQKLSKLVQQQQIESEIQRERYKQKKQKKIKKYLQKRELGINQQYSTQKRQENNNGHFNGNISNVSFLKGSSDNSQLINTKNSKISSIGQQDGDRTLSYVSKLTQDQLKQAMMMNSLNRPDSSQSFRQEIDQLKRIDSFQVSGSFFNSQNFRNSTPLYIEHKRQNDSPQKQNMDKKQLSYWQQPILDIDKYKKKGYQQMQQM